MDQDTLARSDPSHNRPQVLADNRSAYSMATVYSDSASPSTSLLDSSSAQHYGATAPSPPSSKRILANATFKMALIFIVSTLVLGGTLWLALPQLDEDDRPALKIPKSFPELQALNTLLKKYRDIYPYRIVVCYVTTYLFLQAFSLPGSMYLSILGGAVWGVPRALPLACACVASGATLCYLISAALGPALLTIPKWKAWFDIWQEKVRSQRDNIISFLIVLRIAPLPPHWVVNVLCPHLGIGVVPFWVSTFLGIFGVTVIHTSIGGGLDEMTSAKDFHLISWKNFLGLSAVVVGVLIPVGLRYYFKKELAEVTDVEGQVHEVEDDENGDRILEEGPRLVGKGKTGQLVLLSEDEDGPFEPYSDDDSDEDVILEAGPALVVKPDNNNAPPAAESRREWRSEDLL